MNSFWRIFSLEFTAFVRSRSLAMLLAASVAWMFAAPFVFRGDGTAEGARQLAVHYSLGGVAALLAVALLASATGSIARERAAKRLQLTMVRPVWPMTVALAKMAALSAAGVLVLGAAATVEAVRQSPVRPCCHMLSPVLPSPRDEAVAMYDAYLKDPSTPDAVRKAGRSVVLRLLEQRAFDRYESIGTNETCVWRFAMPRGVAGGLTDVADVKARMRFANDYGMRQDVRGTLSLRTGEGRWLGRVGNLAKALVDIPLAADSAGRADGAAELSFLNAGGSSVMLRPRRDVNLLVLADGFGWNLLRACLETAAMLSLLVSLGVFLGAALGRPVALFAAIALLAVAEMSPSVVEQYPDGLEKGFADSVGLCIARAAAEAAHPLSSPEPLARLAEDICVEPREVARAVVSCMVVAPLLFSLLSALVMPRKTYD